MNQDQDREVGKDEELKGKERKNPNLTAKRNPISPVSLKERVNSPPGLLRKVKDSISKRIELIIYGKLE